jgi:prepilin-type processing-associated H-X9-DG protein
LFAVCFFFQNFQKKNLANVLLLDGHTKQLYLDFLAVQDDTIVFLLEPFHRILFGESMAVSNLAGFFSALGNVVSCEMQYKKNRV